MPLLIKHTNPLSGVWHITENADQLLAMLDRKDLYQQQLKTLKNEYRRQEWLAVRVLIKELLSKEPEIAYKDNGAPYMLDDTYNISISHTKGYAAVILSHQPFVGIDIERKSDRILRVRNRFMRDKELLSIDPNHEAEHLYIYWCAKEALFKMIGQQDVDFRKHLLVEPFPYTESGRLTAQELKTSDTHCFKLSYQVSPDFILVWSE